MNSQLSTNHLPRVSVLMSVYNGEDYLAEAVDSILGQTLGDFEFLIVNDGSTDNTKEILESYRDPRIKIIHNKKKIGLTKSLNKGLKLAKGKYVARMDADDISMKNRLELQYDFLENHADTGLVSGLADVIDKTGETVGSFGDIFSSEDIFYLLHFGNCIVHTTVFFRKNMVTGLGGYNERMNRAQDYELWVRLSKLTKLAQIDVVLAYWRDTGFNVSSRFASQQMDSADRISKKKVEEIMGKKISYEEFNALKDFKREMVRITNFEIFKKIIKLLDTFNRNLLAKESGTINKIGLNEKRLIKIIRNKKDKFVYLYFRNNLAGRPAADFFSLPIQLKINLIRSFLKRLAAKVGRLF